MKNFEFMLAKKEKKIEKLNKLWKSEDWGAQEKFDGTRFVLNDGKLISRRVSVKTNEFVDRTDNIPHLIPEIKKMFGKLDGLVIDGEIVHPQGFGECRSAMGSLPSTSIEWQEQNGFVKYKIFDIVESSGNLVWKKPYIKRHKYLRSILSEQNSKFLFVPKLVFSEKLKRELYAKVIERGGEGIILKDLNSPYEFKRSKAWIKVKKIDTFDVVVCGYEDASEWYAKPGEYGRDGKLYKEGRRTKYFEKDWIGAVKYGLYKDGKVIEVGQCSGMPDEVRQEISENKKSFIGMVMEISAQGRMETGGFRHPQFLRFRDDKNPSECKEWQ